MALFVDNASSHSNLYDIREQIVVIPFPPNVTSVHKPMDMVVISTWKQGVQAVFGARIGAGYRVPRGAARILSGAHVRNERYGTRLQ